MADPADRENGAEKQDDAHPALRPDPLELDHQSPRTEEGDGSFEEMVVRLLRQEMQVVRHEIRSELHIGPLPHAKTLEAYEQIVPGSAAMIFREFEEQGQHRRSLETYALKSNTIRSFAGLICGFIVTLSFLFASYLLIKGGHGLAGTILGSVDLVGLVTVFVYGSHVVRDERVRKAKIMAAQDDQEANGTSPT